MADLVMTIDSDSDVENKKIKRGTKLNKHSKPVEEEILLGHSVILTDTNEEPKRMKKHTTGHITGSNNHWNFTESLQMDRKIPMHEDLGGDATTADE